MQQLGNTGESESVEEVFNWVASGYDAGFTHTTDGRRQRSVVHRRLFPILRPESRVLELNCGTGHDAVLIAERSAEVVATDISPEMIRITASKAAASSAGHRVKPTKMAIEDLRLPEVRQSLGRFDLIFSDFDGLNCISDITWLPEVAEQLLNPGGQILMVYLNPAWVPIRVGLGKLRPGRALQSAGAGKTIWHFGEGHKVDTFFHSISRVQALFSSRFDVLRTEAVRLIAPPPLLAAQYERHPALLDWLDDLFSPLPLFNRFGERVLLHLRIKPQ